jgi:hypothetical protein
MLMICCGLACKPADPCDNLQCQYGTCTEGACVCEPYYEGTTCEVESRAKFLGSNWYNSRTCPGDNIFTVSKFQTHTANAGAISITNLHQDPDTVLAQVNGDTVTVPMQVHGFEYVEGTGFYSDGAITVEYTIIETGGGETNCIAHFTR